MKILAVDDDPIILKLLQIFMASTGKHELQVASSATDALELLTPIDADKFDCFLLDIQMHGTNGIELCALLRDIDFYRATPILMLTSLSDKAHIDRAFAAGATDYVTKPFEVYELNARLTLVDALITERRKAFIIPSGGSSTKTAWSTAEPHQRLELHTPIRIDNVDGVIEYTAMENYVTQLGRNSLFGSTVLGFSNRDVETLHKECSSFDFASVITDASEAISDCLSPSQHLVSYAGNGTFVAIIEGGAKPNIDQLVNHINWYLHDMELFRSDGSPLCIKVCSGQAVRMVWRKGLAVIDALIDAHTSAEEVSARLDKNKGNIWTTAQLA
jgi:DNA-binding response OmpR family regulator